MRWGVALFRAISGISQFSCNGYIDTVTSWDLNYTISERRKKSNSDFSSCCSELSLSNADFRFTTDSRNVSNVSNTNCPWKSRKLDENWAKNLQKRCFSAPPTFGACPQKLATFEDKLGQLVKGADKNTLFWRVFAQFSSSFLLFHRQFVYNTDILREQNRTQLAFF